MALLRQVRLQFSLPAKHLSTNVKYVQGQVNQVDNVREYFYAIDHNGQLFLDDARMKNFTSCFKEQKFLRFFYSRIRRTETSLREHFRYTSHCGPERNYVRVNATPFVFTNMSEDGRVLEYNHTGLTQEFSPESMYVGSDGRLYHKFKHKHVAFALVRSSVADFISLNFEYDGKKPVAYRDDCSGRTVKLDYSLEQDVERELL